MFCADCSKSTLFNGHFLCARFYKTETNLVTGETKTRGALTSCDYELFCHISSIEMLLRLLAEVPSLVSLDTLLLC